MSQKTKVAVVEHDINSIIVYRPKLSVFSFSCSFTHVTRYNTKKILFISNLVYGYHDVSKYHILNSALFKSRKIKSQKKSN
jgi:hypothetical protein